MFLHQCPECAPFKIFQKSGETVKPFSWGYLVSAVMGYPEMLCLNSRCSEIYQHCALNQALLGRFEQNTFPLIDLGSLQTPVHFYPSKTKSGTGWSGVDLKMFG